MPLKISVCLVIKNEEKNLSRCLYSVKNLADEIIVVDTGSVDRSLEIAERFTNKVYKFNWNNNFSTARNFGLDKAVGNWILVLDGDEELHIDSVEAVHSLLKKEETEAYFLKVLNPHEKNSELPLDTDLALRLFKNKNVIRYKGIVYEEVLSSITAYNPGAGIETAENLYIIHHGYTEGKNKNRRLEYNMNLLRKAAIEEPENKLNQLYIGFNYYRQHQFEKALNHFLVVYGQAEKEDFYLPGLMRKITLCYYAVDELQEALSFIDNEWIKIFPDMQDIYFIKGITCKNMGDYSRAYDAFQQFLELSPQSGSCRCIYGQDRDKVFYYTGSLAEFFVDIEKALSYYLQSLRDNPRMIISLKRIISILKPRLNPEYTINSLNQVFDLSDEVLQANLAAIFFDEGAYQLALERLDTMSGSKDLSEKIRLIRGLCLMRSGKHGAAVKVLNTISKDKHLYIKAQQNLLLYYWLQPDMSETVRCLENIENAEADRLLAAILSTFAGGEIKAVNQVKGYKQEVKDIIKEIMDFMVVMGDRNSIDNAWQKLTQFGGNRPSGLLAELFYKYEKYDLAAEEYRQLLAGNTDARTIYYLGKSYWGRGDLNKAEVYLHQAAEKGLDIPKVRRELIYLYQELAVRTLRKEIARFPDNQELLQTLKQMEENMLEVYF